MGIPSLIKCFFVVECVIFGPFALHHYLACAHTKEEALDQCMFRVLDVVDPEHPENGSIVQIEHEIRSCVKPNGSKYKSCPLREV